MTNINIYNISPFSIDEFLYSCVYIYIYIYNRGAYSIMDILVILDDPSSNS